MNPFLIVEREDSILTVRMDSPETRNALSEPAQMQEFVDLCAAVKADRSVKVVVLTGNGPAFCAGGNVKDMRERAASSPARPTNCVKATATASSAFHWPSTIWTCRWWPPLTARRSALALTGLYVRRAHVRRYGEVRRELRQARHRSW
jgi:hypothetical protein